MSSKLAKLSGIKKAQGIAGATTGGRVAEKQREQAIAATLDEMTPRTEIDALIDDMRRLLYTLVKEGGWTHDDVELCSSITDPSAAKAMISTLHGALELQSLTPLPHEDWIAIKVAMKFEEDQRQQARLKEASKQAAQAHIKKVLKDMEVHEGEAEWAAEMMEIIPEDRREIVRQQWINKYEDPLIEMESERYRNANLVLLHAAMKANPEKFKEASERKGSAKHKRT